MEALLTRKDVQARYGVHRTTVYRWEKREGLTFERGRIKDGDLAWWMEQADAAKKLGIAVLEFLKLDREEREKLLAKVVRFRP